MKTPFSTTFLTTKGRLPQKPNRGRPVEKNVKKRTQQSELKSGHEIKSYFARSDLPWFCTRYSMSPQLKIHPTIIRPTAPVKTNTQLTINLKKDKEKKQR
jgi:hypothetical protein